MVAMNAVKDLVFHTMWGIGNTTRSWVLSVSWQYKFSCITANTFSIMKQCRLFSDRALSKHFRVGESCFCTNLSVPFLTSLYIRGQLIYHQISQNILAIIIIIMMASYIFNTNCSLAAKQEGYYSWWVLSHPFIKSICVISRLGFWIRIGVIIGKGLHRLHRVLLLCSN